EGRLLVVNVLPNGPARRAGLQADDHIQKIDGADTGGMDLAEAVSRMRGPVDSEATLTVMRKGWDKPRVMTLVRATVSVPSVRHALLAGNVGYVRLENFQGITLRDLQAALQQLSQDSGPDGLQGLVLDLR
ncbi:S41 family peptidase, partial [Corallococcus sp. AB038B]|uniref:S41 family peptidase n=2 Tax=Myxococcaceae TaxID=31 RepID=UPI000ED5EABA